MTATSKTYGHLWVSYLSAPRLRGVSSRMRKPKWCSNRSQPSVRLRTSPSVTTTVVSSLSPPHPRSHKASWRQPELTCAQHLSTMRTTTCRLQALTRQKQTSCLQSLTSRQSISKAKMTYQVTIYLVMRIYRKKWSDITVN